MRWIGLLTAVLLLNAALTFQNIWPTPVVWWRGALSIELAACVLALAAASRVIGPPSPAVVRWLSALWTLLLLGRYADVTAPALYGRDINLFWDLRFIPDVVSMITTVAPAWLVALCVTAAVLVLAVLYRVVRWAWRRVGVALRDPTETRALTTFAAIVIVLFAGQRVSGIDPENVALPPPVTLTYARQARLATLAAATALGPSPAMDADFSRVKDADVFLIFIESYGAVSYDRRDISERLAGSRQQLEAAVHDTHREIVSAYVESPTFGGSSWLAHLSLLSGIDVHDPETNAKLMTESRDTLVRAFHRGGFRTVALMPGMRQRWPEGAFYGFDEIYGADRLAYRGPEFGWFAIPDQFSLERLDTLEVERTPRPPLFVVFPTISTHFPFSPTPPYQPDWRRVPTAQPFDGPDIVRAYARQPDWMNFAPGYVEAIAYDLASIAGYLRLRPDRDFVVILIGDHQPAAAVTGTGASWDVPVHVIASRAPVLERLIASGFRQGVTPARPALARMHLLLPVLLDAFGDRAPR
jgi:hypothetical protein